ncbi:hypothetical protein M426DRAFT_265536 [Hypoxylon sp. CI-4A]|nr:hypothetical protein M426DRAFT_265536 [Hypoxylon sp. CI-4A]
MTSLAIDMGDRRGSTPRPPRAPLGDATSRVLNSSPTKSPKPAHAQPPPPNPLRAHPTNIKAHNDAKASAKAAKNHEKPTNPRDSIVSQEAQQDDKLDSAPSPSLVTSGTRRKTHVGPWKLGKTLGNGSTARVRLVKHKITSELAAVKILSRKTNSDVQPGSIAALDKWDRGREEYTKEKRIPFAIEREVAIMKLIDHPNIVKLYDIWENHSEIYLVLEYVSQGDFYSYIARAGRLSEMEGIYFFRQILSALEYVHSFNICHRDLKLENILVTDDHKVKITDFGMSALHQGPNHMLRTSCGSPHYAAPEIIKAKSYRGDKADLWSLGVILYACLVRALPFNDDYTPQLLAKIIKGEYRLPEFLSRNAQNLISRMLESNPEKRISCREIWQHPAVLNYNHLDDFNNGEAVHEYRQNARYDPVPAEELDKPTLRQLKSVWHTYSELELASKLKSNEANEFKMFYWLFCAYRENRLENYGTDLAYSPSDYHHLQPPNWKKKYTTRQFPSKNGRGMSKFTVISNVATDENGEAIERTSSDGGATVRSYDPYKSSRVFQDAVASKAKIVVHRNGTTSTRAPSVRSGSARTSSTYSRSNKGSRKKKGPASSRRSMASLKSGEELFYRRPVSRRKKGVGFSRASLRSIAHSGTDCRPASIAGHDTTHNRNFSLPISPGKRNGASKAPGRTRSGTQSMVEVSGVKEDGLHWNEELQNFTRSIAKDCDDAFNSTILEESYLSGTQLLESPPTSDDAKTFLTSVNTSSPTPATRRARYSSANVETWDSRPLPPAPSVNDSGAHEYTMAKKKAQRARRITSGTGQIDKMDSQLDRHSNVNGVLSSAEAERRHVSAPIYSQYSTQWGRDKIPLPAINEMSREEDSFENYDKFRAVSAPESSPNRQVKEAKALEDLAQRRNTIRLVDSRSGQFVRDAIPAPLTIRKKPSLSVYPNVQANNRPPIRHKYLADEKETTIQEEPVVKADKGSAGSIKKKTSWFKRGSKDKDELLDKSTTINTDDLYRTESSSSADPSIRPVKKRSFGFAFWRSKEPDIKMSLAGSDYDDDDDYDDEPIIQHGRAPSRRARPPYNKKWEDKTAARNIEPQRNWFARLFRVKPATKYLCLSLPRPYVRHQIATKLKEWRPHGMRDIVVDKARNLIFARVAKKNSNRVATDYNLKEVSFAVELMAVIDHCGPTHLCLVRFTQERGAASTLNRVVELLKDNFLARGMMVTDRRKIKMMIRTLNS